MAVSRDDIPPCTCHILTVVTPGYARSGTDPSVGCLRHPNAGSNSGQRLNAAQLAAEDQPKQRVLWRGIANDDSQFYRDEEPERPVVWNHRDNRPPNQKETDK